MVGSWLAALMTQQAIQSSWIQFAFVPPVSGCVGRPILPYLLMCLCNSRLVKELPLAGMGPSSHQMDGKHSEAAVVRPREIVALKLTKGHNLPA